MLADFCGTTALPDNGVIDRLAGFFFPDNSGFTLVEVLAKADISSDQIAAIGITNQRETTIAVSYTHLDVYKRQA